ncbi:MAG: hypothetical protein GY716_13880 [bacterium]|nr:hypothetical protein [bacterium]
MSEPGDLIGKVVLVGIALHRADGVFIRQAQVHGVVKQAAPETGVVIEDASTKQSFFLPPAFDQIHVAPPGVYRLKETEEEIVNPDFLTQWDVRLPEGANETTVDWQQSMDWRAGPNPADSHPKADESNAD